MGLPAAPALSPLAGGFPSGAGAMGASRPRSRPPGCPRGAGETPRWSGVGVYDLARDYRRAAPSPLGTGGACGSLGARELV